MSRNFSLVLCVLAVTSPLGFLALGKNADSKAEQELVEIDKRWGEAVAHADVKALQHILADEYIGLGNKGEVYNKAEEIEQAAKGARQKATYDADSYQVRIIDSKMAIMVHRGTYKSTENGKEVSETHRSLHTFTKRGNHWQVVASGASTIPPQE